MRFSGAAGLTALTLVGASCAAISGLDGYGVCTDNCDETSRGPSSVADAEVGADAPAIPDETTVEDSYVSSGDVTEGLPDEGTEAVDTGLADVGAPPADAHPGDATPPPVVDSGVDSTAPVVDAGVPGQGPTCGPLSSRTRCSSNQVCCANLAAQTNACTASASCASIATLQCATASDCPSSTPICCAQMTLVADATMDLPPKCTATRLSASCASSCNDVPPSDGTNCKYPSTGTGTVRLCSHNADCTSDTAAAGGGCYNFNGAPISWCSPLPAGLEGIAQP